MEIETRDTLDQSVLTGAGIVLRVVSSDRDLVSTCHQVLRALADADVPPPESGHTEPQRICLWDLSSGQFDGAGARANPPESLLYVVDTRHLDQLHLRLPEAEGNIILKPVTSQVLSAFLGSIAPTSRSTVAKAIGSLRANRDEILQHLLRANLRLQEYDQQRTNFIARAVHDFRAPLTALSGFCGLLAEGELGPLNSVQQEAIDRMRHSIKRISGMASAMFDLSTSPRLRRKPDVREWDIREPVRQALHEVTTIAREKHIDLRADDVQPSPVPLYFEPAQIEQVLVNLLDNACKFVPKQGFVEVRGYPYFHDRRRLSSDVERENRRRDSAAANCYRIDISDNGPGVPRELLENIFEEYTSYSGSQDRSGGGLGLAICRLIVARHGGHVWAEASPEGTTFSFILPFRSGAGSTDSSTGGVTPDSSECEGPPKER